LSGRQLFGTDGVRGRAGHFLTAELALSPARAAVTRVEVERPQVVIVRDTRESGEMLESAIAAGVTAAGGRQRGRDPDAGRAVWWRETVPRWAAWDLGAHTTVPGQRYEVLAATASWPITTRPRSSG
jgi:hypothetical protein